MAETPEKDGYTSELGEQALRDMHSPRRALLDRALLGATVTLLVSGAGTCILGVYRLTDLVF